MDQSIEPIEQHGITSKQAIIAVREVVRSAILTFHSLPDPQRQFYYQGATWADDYVDDYGKEYTPIWYTPSAHEIDQAMIVLPWLKYLGEQEGRKSVLRLIAWCHGISTILQAKREGCSIKTLMNRIDRSVATIIAKFFGKTCTVQVIDEPFKETPFAVPLDFEQRAAEFGASGPPRIMTVYVHGKGLMRNGKLWNNGHDKISSNTGYQPV